MIRLFFSDQQGEYFYALMGPYFASLDVAKELERQVYNKPNTHWYVATSGRSDVLGFASVHDTGKHYFIDNLYVPPDHRRRGIARNIIDHMCETFNDKPLKCIAVNPYALKLFADYGFVEVGVRGKYKRLEKH